MTSMPLFRDRPALQTLPAQALAAVRVPEMIRIYYRYQGSSERSVLVKCEQQNPTGSIKDRTVYYILQKARELGRLRPGEQVVDVCGVNTALALAALGRGWRHPVKVLLPGGTPAAEISLIKTLYAEVQLLEIAGESRDSLTRQMELTGHYDGVFYLPSFSQKYQTEAYERLTGRDIGHQCLLYDIRPAAFIAGVSSGAMLMGIGKYLRTLFPGIKLHPLESSACPVLTFGPLKASHLIRGIGERQIPSVLDPEQLNEVIQVSEADAIRTTRLLADIGLDVGPSSGANLVGAIRLQLSAAKQQEVITVFPDSGQKYRSLFLHHRGKISSTDISAGLELLRFETIQRNP